ncbi:hypothetical protein A2801_02720 [Candidatus Woesebacteria bacterium RIFCSPHIGHO2_01_FULL_41_10]|uniref:Large ribosomal subunit protein bL35 n=1 Tax=Candidatus Woesebacteria bacterium RIFCSPHIGHO2_01_FULL_41_10 TaxID=1802500 RepID=A0A1F7YND3_9BACT|nr:MAG: hypothetical protein A2801_02720 [Candidatus Woesebacteria bacterium RIFCSPHIGHO2_01_FULL_41_10]
MARKQKTRKSVTKRFKVTKNGKVLRRRGFRGHLNVKQSGKLRRKRARSVTVNTFFAKKVKKALGLSTK